MFIEPLFLFLLLLLRQFLLFLPFSCLCRRASSPHSSGRLRLRRCRYPELLFPLLLFPSQFRCLFKPFIHDRFLPFSFPALHVLLKKLLFIPLEVCLSLLLIDGFLRLRFPSFRIHGPKHELPSPLVFDAQKLLTADLDDFGETSRRFRGRHVARRTRAKSRATRTRCGENERASRRLLPLRLRLSP